MNNCKFYKQEKYESLDGGFTWSAMGIYQKGELIESESVDCYVPPVLDTKFFATYSDSTTYSAACDSDTELTTATTKAHTTPYSAMTTAEIGSCVTSIGASAFMECESLSSVTIPNSVTSIGNGVFGWCKSLTSIDIPNSVTSIGSNVFYNCSSLSSVTIPNSVTTISQRAFRYCTSLPSVTIPNSVTDIGGSAFQNCSGLTSIDIPSGITSIGDYAFNNCRSLTSITVESTTPPTLGSRAFTNTNNCPIYVPSGSVETYKSASGWSYYASRIQAIPTPTPVLDTKFFARYSDSTTYSAACDSDTALTSATTKAHTTSYHEMTSAEIGSSCVTEIGNRAFSDCYSLSSVAISNSVTSIGQAAFRYCQSLSSVTIPSGVTTIGKSAFKSCESLRSVTIPSGVTTIDDYTFDECNELTSVTILSNVTSLGECAFSGCISLSSITIPDSVTSIGQAAFSNCYSFTSVTIPSGVTTISDSAFLYCTNITSITCLAITPPTLGYDAFKYTSSNLVIYVPSSSVNAYKAADGWSRYASRIQAMPT